MKSYQHLLWICAWVFAFAVAGCGSSGSNNGDTGASGATGSSGNSGASGSPGVDLLSLVSDRFPAPGATGACADAALRLTFSEAVTLGQAGTIRIFDAATPDTPVVSIDLAAASFDDTIGGRHFFLNRPIYMDGSDAVIYLPSHALSADTNYFVNIDPGVFVSAAGQPTSGISDSTSWAFSTAAPAPADPAALVVARDGSGDFCSVQGAVDFVPAGNTDPVQITIKTGTYHEIVFINTKNNLTVHGEDRDGTVLSYANNDALQHTLGGSYRAMVEVERSNGLVIENLTLHNLTGQCSSGCQAETIRVNASQQVILRDSNFLSLQDTLYLNGQVYVANSLVAGNVDFIWGTGTAYFDHCEIRTVGRKGYNVQARNPVGTYGYVFVDSSITADPGITGHVLARTDARYGAAHVAYINCQIGPHVTPAGWLVSAGTPVTPDLRFWEYQSTDLNGQPLDVSQRDPASRQLSADEAAMMRDKATVLSGWDPSAQ